MIDNIGFWNIRGGHDDAKLYEIKQLISSNNLQLLAIVETKFTLEQSQQASFKINPSWSYI